MYKKIQAIFINKDFFLLLLSRFISQLGDKIFLPAILWLAVESNQGSSTKIGIISFVMVLPVLLSAINGVLVDRYNKKRVMIFTDFLRFFLCGALFLNEIMPQFFWAVVVVIFLIELLGQFYNIASATVIPSIASADQYLKANSYLTVIENVTSIIGFALGGLIIGFWGIKYIILFNGLSFLLSGLCILKIKAEQTNTEKMNGMKKGITRELLEGLKIVFKSHIIRTLLITIFIINIGTASLEMLITIWAHDVLKVGSTGYGFLLTSILVGSLIGSGVVNLKFLKKLSSEATISLAISTFGIIFSLVSFLKNYSLNLLMFCIVGIFLSMVNIHFSTLIMKNTEKSDLGKVFGIVQTSVRGGHPLGIATVTMLLKFLEVGWIIFSIGLTVFVGGVYLIYMFFISSIGLSKRETVVERNNG